MQTGNKTIAHTASDAVQEIIRDAARVVRMLVEELTSTRVILINLRSGLLVRGGIEKAVRHYCKAPMMTCKAFGPCACANSCITLGSWFLMPSSSIEMCAGGTA